MLQMSGETRFPAESLAKLVLWSTLKSHCFLKRKDKWNTLSSFLAVPGACRHQAGTWLLPCFLSSTLLLNSALLLSLCVCSVLGGFVSCRSSVDSDLS